MPSFGASAAVAKLTHSASPAKSTPLRQKNVTPSRHLRLTVALCAEELVGKLTNRMLQQRYAPATRTSVEIEPTLPI